MIYTTNIKTQYHGCDVNGRLKISAAMCYMQQIAGEHLEHLGFSAEKLLRENLAFMLTKTCIKVHQMPAAGNILTLCTAPTAVKGVRFTREFSINSECGVKLISAQTFWVLIDINSRKIQRPANFPYELPLQPSFVGGDIEDISIVPRGTMSNPMPEPTETRSVDIRYSHIDINHHVSNSVYADFICDILPYKTLLDCGVDAIVINFQNEAKYGRALRVERCDIGDAVGDYYICGKSGESTRHFEAFVRLGC